MSRVTCAVRAARGPGWAGGARAGAVELCIGTSRKPEKFVPTPDEYNYTPSFEDFIPVKLGSFEFISDKISRKKFNDMSAGEMKQVYAEVDKLEEMVRGSGNELGLIKNRVDDLGNKAAQLKSRSSTPIIDISSNGIEVEEDVTSMMTDVQCSCT